MEITGFVNPCYAWSVTLTAMLLYVAAIDKRAYAQGMALVHESLSIDWTDCSEVESVPSKVSGVPILKHSRMPADAIFKNYRSGLGAEEIAEVFQLPPEGVRRLLAYAATAHVL